MFRSEKEMGKTVIEKELLSPECVKVVENNIPAKNAKLKVEKILSEMIYIDDQNNFFGKFNSLTFKSPCYGFSFSLLC